MLTNKTRKSSSNLVRGLFILSGLTLLANTVMADTKPYIPQVESVDVTYYDANDGQTKTMKFKASVTMNGALLSDDKKPENGIHVEQVGAYSIELTADDGNASVKNARLDALKFTSEIDANKAQLTYMGVIYREVPKLLRQKFQERGLQVTSLSLVGGLMEGQVPMGGGLNLIYSAEAEAAIPEFSASGMLGVEFNGVRLKATAESRNSDRWDNRYNDTTTGVSLEYQINKNSVISIYQEREKLNARASDDPHYTGSSANGEAEDIRSGVRFKMMFK